MTIQDILTFWFEELTPKQWWEKDPKIDQLIKSRFQALQAQARQCELYGWRKSSQGRLAEIIILDQFSRNIFRNEPGSFESDAQALCLAQEAISIGAPKDLNTQEKQFLYLPFMHSESLVIHDIALNLFSEPGLDSNYDFEVRHRNIIKRFGRYPHRNAILNRVSSPEELEFLSQPGSSF